MMGGREVEGLRWRRRRDRGGEGFIVELDALWTECDERAPPLATRICEGPARGCGDESID